MAKMRTVGTAETMDMRAVGEIAVGDMVRLVGKTTVGKAGDGMTRQADTIGLAVTAARKGKRVRVMLY